MPPAERQRARQERLEAGWWQAELACRAAEEAVNQAERMDDEAAEALYRIARRVKVAAEASTAHIDGRAAEPQPREDFGALFRINDEALARKRETMDAYKRACAALRAAWTERNRLEKTISRLERKAAEAEAHDAAQQEGAP